MSEPPDRGADPSRRRLGPRAAETRRRLLDATEDLLAERSLRDLRVIDVARRVGTSPATFYQYFGDLEEAVLQLAERAGGEMPAIAAEIDAGFAGEVGLVRARRTVDAFIDHWDRHRAVLRVRNLASEEGDPRFRTIRARTHGPIIEALAERVRKAQASGAADAEIHPYAAAAAIASILERLAAYHEELRAFEVEREDLVESSARILQRTLGGDA